MKHCLWISVVCGLVVAGCSKDEPKANTSSPEASKPAVAGQSAPTLGGGWSTSSMAPTVASPSALADATTAVKSVLPSVTNEIQQVLIPAIQSAVAELGQSGGFLNNSSLKLGMPSQLQAVEKVIRGLGQNQLPDQIIAGVNHAAEMALPAAGAVLTNAAAQLRPEDVKAAMTNAPGTNSPMALTQLLRQRAEPQLTQALQPMVKNALDKTGTGSLCQQLLSKGNLNPFAGTAGTVSTNVPAGVESFITTNTLNVFFKVVGTKEAQIRQSLAANAGAK